MITFEVTGAQNFAEGTTSLLDRVRAEGLVAMENIIADLVSYTLSDKLSGQVLARRSGALQASIYGRAAIEGELVVGTLGSKGVPYAAIHEYGGQTAAHEILPSAAKALAFVWRGDKVFFARVNHPGSKMPERSFLRSAVLDMHNVIVEELHAGVLRAAAS